MYSTSRDTSISREREAAPSNRERIVAIVLVLGLNIGLAYLGQVARGVWEFDITRPWTPVGLLAFCVLLVPLGVAYLFTRRWGVRWVDYGLNGRMPTWRIALYAIAATAIIHGFSLYVIHPVVQAVAPQRPDVSHLMNLPGNLVGYILALVVIWITAAFMEELLFRGFLLNETAAALGGGRSAWIGAVLTIGVVFGLGHAYQGLSGVLITGGIGILMGFLYLVLGRNLWPLILAHGAIDTYSITRIYLMG